MSTGGDDDAAAVGTPEQMRQLAAEAEAEADEIEARANAARVRARALRLRREADLAEAAAKAAAKKDTADKAAPEKTDARSEENGGNTQDDSTQGTASAADETDAADDDTADDDTADGDTASATVGDTPPWYRVSRRQLSAALAGLAMLGLVAALVAGVYMVRQHRDADLRRQHAAEFAEAARRGVVALTSLDFNDAEEGVRRILEESTGTFRDDFQKTAKDFMDVVRQSKVVEHGSVKAAAVDLDSMTDDSAVVLVASSSTVSNAAGAQRDPREFRLIVTVSRDGDQIKMSKVEFVP